MAVLQTRGLQAAPEDSFPHKPWGMAPRFTQVKLPPPPLPLIQYTDHDLCYTHPRGRVNGIMKEEIIRVFSLIFASTSKGLVEKVKIVCRKVQKLDHF